MSEDNQRKMSPAAAKTLGAYRETWCAVEMKKEQSWCRKERQHYGQQYKSNVFDNPRPEYEPRCEFKVNAPTHRERRHFEDKCKYSVI